MGVCVEVDLGGLQIMWLIIYDCAGQIYDRVPLLVWYRSGDIVKIDFVINDAPKSCTTHTCKQKVNEPPSTLSVEENTFMFRREYTAFVLTT